MRVPAEAVAPSSSAPRAGTTGALAAKTGEDGLTGRPKGPRLTRAAVERPVHRPEDTKEPASKLTGSRDG